MFLLVSSYSGIVVVVRSQEAVTGLMQVASALATPHSAEPYGGVL